MSDAPDTITLTEHHYDDIRSTGADMLVKVSERSLAARSSQRVAALRARLAELGFAEHEVMLEGVDHTPWAWIVIPFIFIAPVATLFGMGALRPALIAGGALFLLYLVLRAAKVGTVSATLKVHCASAGHVGVVIDEALSSGAEVASLGWRYDVDEPSQADRALKCVERANARAARLAEALDVRILGVHALHEERVLPQATYATLAVASMSTGPAHRAKMGSVSESLGEAPSSAQRAGLRLTIAYRVGGYPVPP
jgi:Protein of unknown function (DUF541)